MSDSISPSQVLLNCRGKGRLQDAARLKYDLPVDVFVLKSRYRREFRAISGTEEVDSSADLLAIGISGQSSESFQDEADISSAMRCVPRGRYMCEQE